MQFNKNKSKRSKKRIASIISSVLPLTVLSPETLAALVTIKNNEEMIVDSQLDLAPGFIIAGWESTKGTLTVSSGGELNTNVLNIAREGGDGEVNIINGGILTINRTLYYYPLSVGGAGSLGNRAAGGIGVLNISGAGSQMIIVAPDRGALKGQLSVGSEGTEGYLNITNGGKLLINQGDFHIGSPGGNGTKGVVIVDGIGSELYSEDRVLIGAENDGRMHISNGAKFKTDSYIGIGQTDNTMTSDNLLTVTGTGSIAESIGQINIGGSDLNKGRGTAVVSDQGTLKASNINIAQFLGSIGELAVGSRKGEAATGAGLIETDSINFGNGAGALTFNHTAADFKLTAAINGHGRVDVINGTTILSGANTYTGETTVGRSGTLQAGAINSFSANSTYNIESGGTLNLNHYDQTISNLTNAGTVTLGGESSGVGTVLTIDGDYVGSAGTLIFNGALNTDDNSITDKLVVTGNSSGNTKVRVNNIGGLGAQTINGIEIIEVHGLSDGNFEQEGRIVAGAYDYFLVRGNVQKGNSDQNWYLNSLFSPTNPDEPSDGGDDGSSGGDDGPSGGGDSINVVRPEAGSYLGLIEHNQNAFNHSFHDRQQLLDNQYQSAWARVAYSKAKSKASNGQLDNDNERTLLHFGADLISQDNLHLGLMGGYARGEVDTSSNLSGNTSTAKSDGYSAGVYATWFEQNKDQSGPYFDAYVQYNWFDNTVNGKGLAEESFSSNGYTLSTEAGYSFILGKLGNMTWQVEPQVQFLYNSYDHKNHTEQNGTRVNIRNSDNFISRVGVRLQGTSETVAPFITLNYWNHSKNAGISMNDVHVNSGRALNIFEVKAGGQFRLNKSIDLFTQLIGSWGNHSTNAYGGNVGLKVKW